MQDLEASLAASMNREKETMEQTAALEKEKENLARELASYINKEKEKVDFRLSSRLVPGHGAWVRFSLGTSEHTIF